MPEWYVSEADVKLHPLYDEKKCDKKLLDKILFSYGMDVSKGYIDDERWKMESTGDEELDSFDYYHKSLSGEIVKCPRYVGMARTDGDWPRFINRLLDLPVEFTRKR